MKEFAMALWSMTAPHHQWPMPPDPSAAVVQSVREPGRSLGATERQELKDALIRGAQSATGKFRVDEKSGLSLPEMAEPRNAAAAGGVPTKAER